MGQESEEWFGKREGPLDGVGAILVGERAETCCEVAVADVVTAAEAEETK